MLTGRPRTITLNGCWDAAASLLMFQGCLHYQKKLTARVFKGKVWTILVCNFRIWAGQIDGTISKLSFHTCCVWLVGYIKVNLVMAKFFFYFTFFSHSIFEYNSKFALLLFSWWTILKERPPFLASCVPWAWLVRMRVVSPVACTCLLFRAALPACLEPPCWELRCFLCLGLVLLLSVCGCWAPVEAHCYWAENERKWNSSNWGKH